MSLNKVEGIGIRIVWLMVWLGEDPHVKPLPHLSISEMTRIETTAMGAVIMNAQATTVSDTRATVRVIYGLVVPPHMNPLSIRSSLR